MRIFSSFGGGDKKMGTSFLQPFEERYLRDVFVPRIPSWIETYHLTLCTIPWCLGIMFFSYLARSETSWLWVVSLLILLQYITDLFDGSLGRMRKTGLVKWGYYMDHFLDYFFLCAVLIGYFFVLPDALPYQYFFILAIFGGYMIHEFLAFAVTNKLQVSYFGIGPTEVRLAFIIVNTLLTIFGTTHMGTLLPYILIGSLAGLVAVVYRTQHAIWKMDMEEKKRQETSGQ